MPVSPFAAFAAVTAPASADWWLEDWLAEEDEAAWEQAVSGGSGCGASRPPQPR